jgi:hypothetical protein
MATQTLARPSRTEPAKRIGLRAAINAKCRDCIHDPAAPGTWREQVAQCSAINCPLWPYRPEPRGGPFANPPRDPATVTLDWVRAPVGEAFSPLPLGAEGENEAHRVES